MKMSDKFELPLIESRVDARIGCAWSIDGKAEYIAHAINNHDRLSEENAKLREVLGSLVKESLSLADFKNKTLKRSICSTDLDEPEWHDYQTIAEADLLLNQLKDKKQ